MSAFNKLPAVLPQLAYPYNALEPAISGAIMELHHSKHHQAYVTNLNKAQEDFAAATQAQDIKKQIALQAALKFNGGGHINHTLFWENLAPTSAEGGKFPSSGKLYDQVQQDFGGLDGLKKAVNTAALGIQGSGWAWLGYNPQTKKLETVTTANQDPLLGYVPIVGIDMWEHAYYLDYKNVKATYLDNIWSVVNWKKAEERLTSA
ncbi:Fe-Mn family superoxide dismutase [Rhodotorula taiwanensis]|uniref:Superoxide dismutase n=1 Tax=Rhodotorula taiwanensis TaxID=741276 RepID=A0A2S5B770_9BASI|nr:Fe-Mn family superoxide dismutase [Rhodotorula taiwanensis]